MNQGPAKPQAAGVTIGVDTGGTFTDLVLIDAARRVMATHKLLSTPGDPARAVLTGIDELLSKAGLPPRNGCRPHVVHGSTVATNALLEGATEPPAFITTAGFEDTLHIARQNRPDLYAPVPRRPDPPVQRSACLGAAERLTRDGSVLRPLTDEAVAGVVERVRALGAPSVAISLLHSYANPAHERRLAEALRRALPGMHVTVSSELLPEYREYERAATCIVNAAVAPGMADYLGRLSSALGEDRLRIMASHGGTLPPAAVIDQPVRTILSGPAGGALGAAAAAKAAGIGRVITLDMGGTSTDVALIDGEPALSNEGEAADLPIRLPMIDLHTVGAGGGSIAWLDPGGALRVGPRSAGADPGPACYGRQRGEPVATVTDAHVVLGHLAGDQTLGSDLRIDADAAAAAVEAIARRVGLGAEEAATGILRIAEATMTRAVQRVSLQRGRDPRDFALLPFGGAGGLHACRLAQSLGMTRVLVPTHPGLLSAVGMLGAAPRHTFSKTLLLRIEARADGRHPWPTGAPPLREAWAELQSKADAAMANESVGPSGRIDRRSADLRYAGQSYEITVPCNEADDDPLTAFLEAHQRLYGYVAPGKTIELVTARLHTGGVSRPIQTKPAPRNDGTRRTPPTVTAGPWRCLHRDTLKADDPIGGGTIIREASATILVPPGWRGIVDPHGLIVLERGSNP